MKPARLGFLVIAQIRDDGKLDTVAAFNLANDNASTLAKHTFDQLRWTDGDEFFVFNTALVPSQIDASAMCCRRPKTEPLIDVMPIQN